jgi:ABC-type Na+ efflux pump permease subunit
LIEEKSSRVVEVLLSSVTPSELMMGKLAGIATVGLVMLTAWIGTLVGIVAYMALSAAHAVTAGSAGPAGIAAEIPHDVATLLTGTWLLPAFAIYFILGYLLYAGLFLALGSTCNTIKDAQNYMAVIVLFLMVPLLSMAFIPRDPNGPVATFLSWIPPYTPFVMMNRIVAHPPWRDVIGTFILLVAFDGFVLWGCGKVFRIGVLRTGQPPGLIQVLGWLRLR